MRKRIITAAFLLSFAVAAAGGCGGTGNIPFVTTGASAAVDEVRLDIALVSSGAGIDDGSFIQDNYNGICDFVAMHKGSLVTTFEEPSGDPDAALEELGRIAGDYNVIVCTGYQYAGITAKAREYPDTKFILVDAFPIDETGKETTADNIYAVKFREEESGFLAGMSAALTTQTKKVAIVNAYPIDSNLNYMYGFLSGVNYINRHLSKDVRVIGLPRYAGTDGNGKSVGGNFIGSFSDVEKGRIIGKDLISEGVDVIFGAAGYAGAGVLDAVKESGAEAFFIGADTDRSRDGVVNGKNVVLTSALKNMGASDRMILESAANGSFKGGNYILGAETGATGYVNAPERCRLTDDAIKIVDSAYKYIKEGLIVPASCTNGLSPDDFTGIELWAKR